MSNGEISSNTATLFGGGVYVKNSTFAMSGGKVQNNSASYKGGGVYVGDKSTFTVSGAVVISGNAAGGETAETAENVYLPSGTYINLGGELTSGASIGVTTATSLAAGEAVQITTETGSIYNSSASGYFTSDNTAYRIRVNSNGYLELYGEPITGTVTIFGTPTYGQTLEAVTSDVPAGMTYRWMRGETAIENATESTYNLTVADVGQEITVEVTHDNYVWAV